MKQTLRQLTISLVALLLCFSMLLGTTYAWFTDSVTSSNNIIKAGNLDLKVFWTEDIATPDWKDAEDSSKGAIFDYDKWEPGYTSVRYIKIVNDGNLAFKYLLSIIPNGTLGILADVIDVYYVENASQKITSVSDMTAAGTLCEVITNNTNNQGVLLPVGTADADNVNGDYVGELVIAIALKMRESAGNEYQNQSVGSSFSIQVLATQYTFEGDSFDNIYDRPSQWPGNITVGDNSITTDVAVSNNLTTAEYSETTDDGNIVVNYPVGIGVNDGTDTLTLTVRDKSKSDSNITLDENEASLALDVHVDGVSEDNVVPIEVVLKNRVPAGLNMGNYRLYHVEDGQTVAMTYLEDSDPAQHNGFRYDPATGDLTLYLKSFSEVDIVANTVNAWNGTIADKFAGGDGTAESPYLIANADQLAYLNDVISNDNGNYGDKHYKLLADINLGGEENANEGKIFYPIGYHAVGGTIATIDLDDAPEFVYFEEDPDYAVSHVNAITEGGTTTWYTYGGAFKGTFDGNGNTISNIYQNTWQMKGDYDGHYWNDAMGIFGYVYGGTIKNLTVDNFTSDGEFTPTGVIAAYAANATFENIAITNCNPRVYNTGNGGIVGVGGNSSDTTDKKLTFKNITVDNTNKISALWGSWDVACGGIMGMFRGNGLVHFENCHIGAQIDVYNDVCGNYQYYWYRYAGMVIGSIRGKNIVVNGYTVPDTTGIKAANCTVHFGDWNDYYYCELVANTIASYTHDHQFSRLTKISSLDDIKNGDTWTKTGNFLLGGECYHIVNKNGTLTRHFHEDAGTETVNGETVLKEDKQVVYLPFNQLIQGDGWGVKTIGFRNDSELDFDGITILDRTEANSIAKFEALVNGNNYEEGKVLTIGEIFAALNGVSINTNTLMVFVSPVGEGSTASAIYTPNTSDWTKGTLTFSGSGAAKIVITDYTYCREAVASVTIDNHEHSYKTEVTAPTCTEGGYTTYTCACGDSYVGNEVAAKGHSYKAVVTAPTCTVGGYTIYTCDCGDTYKDNTVAATGHKYKEVVTAPTCTEAGYTTYTCDCGDTYTNTVEATGHKYDEVVTAPTCTANGYTTYTCTCGDTYTANETDALGHIEKKFTGDFLYRVGNKNAVQLSSLFDVGNRSVTDSDINVSGNASVVVSGTTLTFSGTGVITVTLTDDCTCGECVTELTLEVVDAVNATSATSAKSNNVVLLNDVGLYTIEVSGGYTLYGNGFKMTATSDPMYDTMRAGFVTLDNGTLDNVQIICPNFSYAIIYNSQIKESGNTAKPSDSSNDARGNVRSAVMVTGNSKIVNSYVHGGRAAIFLRSGNLVIDGSTISGGAAANIHALSAQSLTLRNATLIQKPYEDNVHGTGNTLMGFSVLLECGEDGNSTPVILEGTLVQDAWINESYVKYTPSAASSIVENALGKTAYLHDLDGDGKNESLNLGFTYIPQNSGGSTNADVTDNRTDKNTVPYAAVDVGTAFASAKVYSYKNTNGTSDDFKNVGDYAPTTQGATAPIVSFDDTNADRVFETKFDANDGLWESTLTVNLDNGNYTFGWDKLLVQKHGEKLTYTVKTKEGTAVDTSKSIALTASGITEYELTAVTDDGAIHTVYFTITASKTSIPDPVVADTTGGTPLLVVKSKNSDWSCALPALEGITVKYYTVDGEVILDLATLTPTSTGKQNGTNNYWETTKDGYKLKVTCGVIHDTKSVYGMPVVVNNGGNKLYFTISSTNGYVSTNTAARSVKLTYEFTDPNGKTLTFEKTWDFQYSDYKNGKQYSYSDFVNGTLKEASSGGCVTPDTLVTLADGSQKRIDQVTYYDKLLVWNFKTGEYDVASSSIVMNHGYDNYDVVELTFSDGTKIKTINGHGFFDVSENKFVILEKANVSNYIGHNFVKQNGIGYDEVTLVGYNVWTEYTESRSLLTVEHYNCVLEGLWTITPAEVENSPSYLMPFAITDDMKYDAEKMQADIAKYGLYTYDVFADYCTYEQFEALGLSSFKVSVGKGYITVDDIIFLLKIHAK